MQLVHSVKVSYEVGCYVLDGVVAKQGSLLCFSNSNQLLKCYDSNTAAYLFDITGHTAPITDVVCDSQDGTMLVSSQLDTGVMISDLRIAQPVHYLTELQGFDLEAYSVSINPSGTVLAVAAGADIHLVDVRTWHSTRSIENLHVDTITRVRFFGEAQLCTAGEDQLVNFLDVTESEDDMMLSVINVEEAVNKIGWFPSHGVITLAGTMENGYVCPLSFEKECKISRPSSSAYIVDFINCNGQLCLVGGTHGEEGVGPLSVVAVPEVQTIASLPGAHSDVVRVALNVGDTIVTAGEDGLLAFWSEQTDEQFTATLREPRKEITPPSLKKNWRPY